MASVRLPILNLAVRAQRYSCHGCGNCCRDFTVQLREEDLEKLREQAWESKLGEPITVTFRGVTYLRQRADGGCIFFMDDGRCRIHAEHGFEEKPIACQLFPFTLSPAPGGAQMGVSFACRSVQENKGAELPSHVPELKRMAGHLPEVLPAEKPPMLTENLRASAQEVEALTRHIDRWMTAPDLDLPMQLDGLAWIAGSLGRAQLENVRGDRFGDLLDVLFEALPDELPLHPIDPPTARQRRLMRQAAFTRVEDVKLRDIERLGRWRITFGQLRRSRRYAKGRGTAPLVGVGWPEHVRLEQVEGVAPASERESVDAIADLMRRWVRATVLGGRGWGPGYYGWPVVRGLQALVLNLAVTSWLARVHALGREARAIDLEDVRAALGRVDRTSGRAAWLAGSGERMRLRFFTIDHGLRRVVNAYPLVVSVS